MMIDLIDLILIDWINFATSCLPYPRRQHQQISPEQNTKMFFFLNNEHTVVKNCDISNSMYWIFLSLVSLSLRAGLLYILFFT